MKTLLILLASVSVALSQMPPLPSSVVSTNKVMKTNYIAVTARNLAGLDSDYSKELAVPDAFDQVSVTWDKNPEPDIVGYRVYYGTNSRSYASSIQVTTNFATITFRTNVWELQIVATSDLWSGTWVVHTNWPTIVTNPTGSRFYKLEWKKR